MENVVMAEDSGHWMPMWQEGQQLLQESRCRYHSKHNTSRESVYEEVAGSPQSDGLVLGFPILLNDPERFHTFAPPPSACPQPSAPPIAALPPPPTRWADAALLTP
eukprot:TRINITY_DN2594_c0_g3_i1.p1 TRINITY_DN2594_c0_g3~~TRINITY_DN2594_c0_g3_i1.p1  ORF type:complete len:106 (+),score=18.12 TRINITY_DN2594_c0_g3_i1:295-612(+)